MTAKNIKPASRTHAAPVAVAREKGLDLKPWMIDLIACVAILLAILVMFNPIALGGKAFSRGDDTEAAASWNTYAMEEAQARQYPAWCPYVFGGFPSLAAGAYSNYNEMGMPYALANRYLSPRYWADVISMKVLFLGGSTPMAYDSRWYLCLLLYGGLFTYLLMRRLGFTPLIGVFSGLMMALNPYLISLATAAHGGKMLTFIYIPLIVLLAWNVMEKRRLLDLALLALGFGWQIAVGGHTQILFYSFVTVGILYIMWLIFELREQASITALKPALYIGIALILGLAVGALWYIPLFKYLPYSIRGMGPAIAKAGSTSGYSLADATQWSFSPSELITFVVPSWFGLKSPYYWGDMPFTSSSFYFGVVPLLFAIFAFFGKKDRLFWSLFAVAIFSILLSFGSHFEIFYSFFFNVLPFFNKFRTPSLILLLVVLVGLIYSGYGLRFVMDLKDSVKWRKAFLVGAAICAGLLVVFLFTGDALSGLFGSFSKAGENYSPEQMTQLRQIRFGMLRGDLLVALLWLMLAFGACWLKLSGKIKTTAFLALILLIALVDIWRFSIKFFDPQPKDTVLETLQPNKVVETLKQDHTAFRVLPLGRLMQDNRWAAWEIASLGGYHGAKMREYQDLADNVFSAGPDPRIPLNMAFFSAMNCKYVVAEGQLPPTLGLDMLTQDPGAKMVLYKNPAALDRVFFADSIIVDNDRTSTIQRLMAPTFPYHRAAVVDKPLPGPVVSDTLRTAKVTDYFPEQVKITARCSKPSFLVLSDAYYGPGWQAVDNGAPATIYKVDGFVRGLYLSPGNHDLEYRYTGKYEKEGVYVATISHFLVWGLVIGAFWWERKRRQSKVEQA